jgi:hypothetical protein
VADLYIPERRALRADFEGQIAEFWLPLVSLEGYSLTARVSKKTATEPTKTPNNALFLNPFLDLTVRYSGTLPMRDEQDDLSLECRGVGRDLVETALAEEQRRFDQHLTKAPAEQLVKISEAMQTELLSMAALVGWADPRVAGRVALLTRFIVDAGKAARPSVTPYGQYTSYKNRDLKACITDLHELGDGNTIFTVELENTGDQNFSLVANLGGTELPPSVIDSEALQNDSRVKFKSDEQVIMPSQKRTIKYMYQTTIADQLSRQSLYVSIAGLNLGFPERTSQKSPMEPKTAVLISLLPNSPELYQTPTPSSREEDAKSVPPWSKPSPVTDNVNFEAWFKEAPPLPKLLQKGLLLCRFDAPEKFSVSTYDDGFGPFGWVKWREASHGVAEVSIDAKTSISIPGMKKIETKDKTLMIPFLDLKKGDSIDIKVYDDNDNILIGKLTLPYKEAATGLEANAKLVVSAIKPVPEVLAECRGYSREALEEKMKREFARVEALFVVEQHEPLRYIDDMKKGVEALAGLVGWADPRVKLLVAAIDSASPH